MAVTIKTAVFWDVAPCRSCVNRRFGGTYDIHLQGRRIRGRGTSLSRRRRYVPPKRRFTQDLHGAASHKTAFFKRDTDWHSLFTVPTSTSYKISRLLENFVIKTVHIPVKKSSHLLRSAKDDLRLKFFGGLQYAVRMWKSVYRTDRSIN
jgi:hypothetical protein